MRRARRVGAWVLALAGTSSAFAPVAMAQVTPTPTPRPATVTGEVTGALMSGSTLSISVDATMPGGWEGLHLVEVRVLDGSEELEHLVFDIENNQLTVGEEKIAVGTGAVAEGEYLRVSGSQVVVTTGAGNLSFGVDASVIRTIPEGARFELSVTDDFENAVGTTVRFAEPDEGGGLTWGTVITVVIVALLAGGFVGNLFASHRRPPARMSVYGTIAKRIDADRKPAAR